MQFDDKLVNSANKTIEKIYEKILEDIENGPNIIYKEFEKEFIFENFFSKYLRFADEQGDSIKMRLCEEMCFTIACNNGDVTIVELSQMFTGLKETKKIKYSQDDILPVEFNISLNGQDIVVNDLMSADEIYDVIHNSSKEKEVDKMQNKQIEIQTCEKKEEPKKQKKNSFLGELIRTIVPTAVITLLFLYLVGQLAIVCGSSMNDTLYDGDIVFMEKITQRFGELDRFDVIVFDSNLNNHQEFIKRIVGLPGETVRIDESGNIYVNEELVEENYGKEVMVYSGIASEGVTLKENEYFVLGDNRNNSKDSRFPDLGVVNYYQIKGRVCISLIPFVTVN